MGYNHQHYGTAGFFYLHTVPGILAWDRFSVLKSRHSCRERSINMDNWLARTRLLLGDEAVNSLRHSRVAVLGLGGVGGAAAEAICRSGVGAMLLADYDRVDITNLNRQLIAVTSTVGHDKTEAAARRLPGHQSGAGSHPLGRPSHPRKPARGAGLAARLYSRLHRQCHRQTGAYRPLPGTGHQAHHLPGHRQPSGPVHAPGGEPPGHRRAPAVPSPASCARNCAAGASPT